MATKYTAVIARDGLIEPTAEFDLAVGNNPRLHHLEIVTNEDEFGSKCAFAGDLDLIQKLEFIDDKDEPTEPEIILPPTYYPATTHMIHTGNSGYAYASPHSSQYPTSKPYDYIWGGIMNWQTTNGIGPNMISRWSPSGTQQSFIFALNTDAPRIPYIYSIILAPFMAICTVPTPFPDGTLGFIKLSVDVTANEVRFYYSYDNVNWIQLGATIGAGGFAQGFARYHDQKNAWLVIGGNQAASNQNAIESHYAKIQYTDESVVHATFDASGNTGQGSFVSPEGDTWIIRSPATLVNSPAN